jgi:hypothetical protein
LPTRRTRSPFVAVVIEAVEQVEQYEGRLTAGVASDAPTPDTSMTLRKFQLLLGLSVELAVQETPAVDVVVKTFHEKLAVL